MGWECARCLLTMFCLFNVWLKQQSHIPKVMATRPVVGKMLCQKGHGATWKRQPKNWSFSMLFDHLSSSQLHFFSKLFMDHLHLKHHHLKLGLRSPHSSAELIMSFRVHPESQAVDWEVVREVLSSLWTNGWMILTWNTAWRWGSSYVCVIYVLACEVNTGLVRVGHKCFSHILLIHTMWNAGTCGGQYLTCQKKTPEKNGIKPGPCLALSTKRLLHTGQHRSTVMFTSMIKTKCLTRILGKTMCSIVLTGFSWSISNLCILRFLRSRSVFHVSPFSCVPSSMHWRSSNTPWNSNSLQACLCWPCPAHPTGHIQLATI